MRGEENIGYGVCSVVVNVFILLKFARRQTNRKRYQVEDSQVQMATTKSVTVTEEGTTNV